MVDLPRLKKLVINGVDVSSYLISANGEADYSESVSAASFVLSRNVDSVLTIDPEITNKEITYQRGVNTATEYYKFRGFISKYDQTPTVYVISAKNKYWQAQQRLVTASYDKNIDAEAGKLSEIALDLITYYAGLNANNTTIQDSGTVLTVNKFVCRRSQVYERVDMIANALNWQHYYNDYDDYVYMEPRGFIDSGITLQVGSNIVDKPTFATDRTRLCNDLTVEGAVQSFQKTEFFNGNNTTGQKFVLAETPTSIKVYVGTGTYTPSSGTKPSITETNLKTGGKVNSTSGSFDYTYDDEPNVKTVYFKNTATQPSYTPPTGTNNVEIQYTYEKPTPVQIKNQESIDSYGLSAKVITKDDIKTVADAEVYAQNYIDRFKTPFQVANLKVAGIDDIRSGRYYRVVDLEKGIDQNMIVSKTRWFYPYKPDEITVGDAMALEQDISVNLLDRVKRLEEKDSKNNDLLVHLFFQSMRKTFERRYTELQLSTIAGDVGIYGHSVYGIYGTAKYGTVAGSGFILGHTVFGILGTGELGSTVSTPVTTKLIQGNNTYKEYLYDEIFKGASSTAVWNTTTKQLEFDIGEFIITSAIALGTQYNYVTVNFANAVGSFDVEISGDNKVTWQLLTLGVRTAINVTDTKGVYLKITALGNANLWPTQWGTWGTAVIDIIIGNTYTASLGYLEPAIKVVLEE